jgi:transcription termination/antitermination protein NusG
MTDDPVIDSGEPETTNIVEDVAPVEGQSETAVAVEEVPVVAEDKKKWYVVKVQSGREESIRAAVERRIKIENLEPYIGRILIPKEKIVVLRNGKRVTKKQNKFPGYLFVEVEFNEYVLYLFRDTAGVGDFVGASLHRAPTPMPDLEVEKMLREEGDDAADAKVKDGSSKSSKGTIVIPYNKGDRVKVNAGTFAGMEGEVKEILEPATASENPKVKVEVSIWGRPVNVEVEYYQVEQVS